MIKKTFVSILIIVVLGLNASAQNNDENKIKLTETARLVESSPYQGSEIASLKIDVLRNEMRNNPNSKGVFVIYCGKNCQYGEVEAHINGLSASLNGKGWKTSEFAILQGGYREELIVEYWMVPENACLPIPKSEIDIKDVKFKGTYKRKFVAYDCCE